MSNDLTNALNSLIDQMNHHLSSGEINDSGVQDSLNNVVIPDSQSNGLVDQFPVSGFDSTDIFHHPQPDYSLPDSANPHYQQHDYHQSGGYEDSFTYSHGSYNFGDMGNHEYHSLSFASKQMVMESSSHHHCPYTTISDSGDIYKHTSDSSSDSYYVGHINGRSVYNLSNDYLGYAGTDGKVYDNYDHCVGWTDGCHVYNKSGVEVYETTKGVVGAAAYLLCVYYGGVD